MLKNIENEHQNNTNLVTIMNKILYETVKKIMKKYVIEVGIFRKIVNKNKCILLIEKLVEKLTVETHKIYVYIGGEKIQNMLQEEFYYRMYYENVKNVKKQSIIQCLLTIS